VIFAFAEDGTVSVYADLDALRGYCEGIDVESGTYVFYDEDGVWLRPRFIEPNRPGWLGSIVSGRYLLEPAPTPADVDPIEVALAEASGLDANPWFRDLDALRAHVAARRAKATR